MKIFDEEQESFPDGFDAITIRLDGRMQADLNWTYQLEKAAQCVDQGMKIFWEIDLGLFQRLYFSLADQPQFLAFCLSLDHFRETVWQKFSEQSIGLCLYRGNADFSHGFPWDGEQLSSYQEWLTEAGVIENDLSRALFCRDAVADYLDLLAGHLPDYIPCYCLLDCTGIEDPVLLAQLLHKERYPKLTLGVKAGLGVGYELLWKDGSLESSTEQALHGICLPTFTYKNPVHYQRLGNILKSLLDSKASFKLIPENLLTTEWDGLDFLHVLPESITPQGKRKLQGFCAAGGTIIEN